MYLQLQIMRLRRSIDCLWSDNSLLCLRTCLFQHVLSRNSVKTNLTLLVYLFITRSLFLILHCNLLARSEQLKMKQLLDKSRRLLKSAKESSLWWITISVNIQSTFNIRNLHWDASIFFGTQHYIGLGLRQGQDSEIQICEQDSNDLIRISSTYNCSLRNE